MKHRSVLFAAIGLGMLLTAASPALAQHRGDGWHGGGWHGGGWHGGWHGGYGSGWGWRGGHWGYWGPGVVLGAPYYPYPYYPYPYPYPYYAPGLSVVIR
jgi:hypothetical protein